MTNKRLARQLVRRYRARECRRHFDAIMRSPLVTIPWGDECPQPESVAYTFLGARK